LYVSFFCFLLFNNSWFIFTIIFAINSFGDGEIEFYIDEENKDNIIDFLKEKGMDKLRHIFSRICNGKQPPKDVYSQENLKISWKKSIASGLVYLVVIVIYLFY
jgi:hypothetical protein